MFSEHIFEFTVYLMYVINGFGFVLGAINLVKLKADTRFKGGDLNLTAGQCICC